MSMKFSFRKKSTNSKTIVCLVFKNKTLPDIFTGTPYENQISKLINLNNSFSGNEKELLDFNLPFVELESVYDRVILIGGGSDIKLNHTQELGGFISRKMSGFKITSIDFAMNKVLSMS